MADNKTIGAKIVLDGTKEYKDAISMINSETKTLKSEANLLDAQFKSCANSTEALTAKHENLAKQVEKQKQKVGVLSDALETSNKNMNKAGENVEKWKQKLSTAEDALEKLKNSSDATTDEIKEQEEAVEKAKNGLATAERQYASCERATNSWETQLNNAQTELYKLNDELEENDEKLEDSRKELDRAGDEADEFGDEIDEAESEVSTFGDTLKANLTAVAIVEGIRTLADSAKDLGEKLYECGRGAAAYADDILTMSNNTHLSTDTLQEYRYAADLIDVSLETLTKTMAKNIKSMENARNGSALYEQAYQKLNVAITDSNGNLRDSEEVYWDVIDALGQVSDETEADTIAMQLFGKSAQDLNSLVKQGSTGFKELAAEAREMGAVLDSETLSALGETDDAMVRLDQSTQILSRQIGSEIAPILTEVATKITDIFKESGDDIAEFVEGGLNLVIDGFSWIADHGAEIASIISGIVTALVFDKAVSTITNVIDGLKGMASSIKEAAAEQGLLNAVLNANPTSLFVTALTGVSTALITYATLTKDTSEEEKKRIETLKKLRENHESLAESIEVSNKAFESGVGELEAQDKIAKDLVKRLYELEGQTNKTAAEKKEMQNIIKQLNTILPDLGLEIDSVTGKLNKEKDAVLENINSMKKQAEAKVYIERYNKALEEQVKAQMNVTEATDKVNEAKEKCNGMTEEEIEWIKKLGIHTGRNTEYYGDEADALIALEDKYGKVIYEIGDLIIEQEKEKEQLEKTKETTKKYGDELVELGYATDEVTEENGELEGSIEGVGDAAENTAAKLTGTLKTSFGDLTFEIETTGNKLKDQELIYDQLKTKVEQSYAAQKAAAAESIESQMNLWDEFGSKTNVTGEKLKENLETQIDALEEWDNNIQRIAKVCSEDFVNELKNMGISSSEQIAALSDMTDEELKEYEELWRTRQGKIGEISESMIGDIDESLKELIELIKEALDKAYGDGEDAGRELVDGTTAGINNNKTSVPDAVKAQGAAAVQAWQNSTQGRELGQQFAEDTASGITDRESVVKNAVNQEASLINSTLSTSLAGHEHGKQFVSDTADGITSNKNKSKSAAKEVAQSANSGFESGEKAKKEGQNYSKDVASGITDSKNKVNNAAGKAAKEGNSGFEKNEKANSEGQTYSKELASGMKGMQHKVYEAGQSLGKKAKEGLNMNADGKVIGKQFVQGVADGITSNSSLATNAARRMAQNVKNTVNSELDIHSPSRVARQQGEYFGEGLALGIEDKNGRVSAAGKKLTSQLTAMTNKSMSDALKGINMTNVNVPQLETGITVEMDYEKLADTMIERLRKTTLKLDKRAAYSFIDNRLKEVYR